MKPYLLDVNVLIALAWPSHVHHLTAQDWFARKRGAGFRTCPLTQTGFVTLSCNPAFIRNAASPASALRLLGVITTFQEHEFWPDDLAATDALTGLPLIGHRQVTDAYLLALARNRGGILATLDRAAFALAGAGTGGAELVIPQH